MIKTRLQTILILVTATLAVAILLLTEMVTSANAVDQPSERSAPSGTTETAASFTINVGINPVGSGQIRIDPPGLPYGDGASVPISGDVLLTPNYDPDYWQFTNWTGSVMTTTSPLPLSATQDYNITANFTRRCFNLTLEYTGGGAAGEKPVATSTSAFCDPGQYAFDEMIDLQAMGITNWRVAGWSGTDDDLSTEYTNTALMPAADHTIVVHYEPICYELTFGVDPLDAGMVTRNSDPNCPVEVPGNRYHQGTTVSLNASPSLGYKFNNWSGDTVGDVNVTTMVIAMDQARNITANFKKACHTLSLTHAPSGSGSDPSATPDRSPQCAQGEYVAGFDIDLSATPNPGWQVESWLGADDPNSTSNSNTLSFPALPANTEGHVVTVNYIKRPTLQFSAQTYSVNENVSETTITVKRTGSLSETVSVRYATSNGSAKSGQDYFSTNGTLNFPPETSERSFVVKIKDDSIKEGTENLFLTLSNPSGAILGSIDQAQLFILDDEGDPTVQFSTTSFEALESSPTVPITITLFPASINDVIVEFNTMDGTGTNNEDYLEKSETVRFKSGESSKIVEVTLLDDSLDEPDETVELQLSDILNAEIGDAEAMLTLIDDDASPTVQFSDNQYFAKEGGTTTPVTVTLSAASALSVTVDYEVIELTVGRQIAGAVLFDPGEEIQIIDIPIGSYQSGDTLNIVLSNAENATLAAPSSASLAILPIDRSECHRLVLQNTGYGSPPITTSINSSLECATGHFVANELIDVRGEPDPGWVIDGWNGTLNDSGTTKDNVVRMPDSDHTATVHYLTSAYLPTIAHQFASYFEGPMEEEPNSAIGVSNANGPLRSGRQYFGRFPSTNDTFDIFYVYLVNGGDIQVELTDIPAGRDYNLYLYSASVELKGYSGSVEDNDEHISSSNLPRGVYYITIHFASGAPSTAQYKITTIYK